jgi:hypothetical protein
LFYRYVFTPAPVSQVFFEKKMSLYAIKENLHVLYFGYTSEQCRRLYIAVLVVSHIFIIILIFAVIFGGTGFSATTSRLIYTSSDLYICFSSIVLIGFPAC